ncbi:MAG TPA: UDP-glucose 4-epimerase GalE [Actinomycetes bacterium]|nr:UDP-glucose 4-epimerase GalE [Actinomycetes bacterium]
MTTWLVTGGAGYIGSHVARALRESGRDVVVLDDLSTGLASFVDSDVAFVHGDVDDPAAVRAALAGHVAGVVHLAAFKYAGVSVERPLETYRRNVSGTITLLEGMLEAGVQRLVFSSSAGVYGTPHVDQVTEETPHAPESPYGASKSMDERIIDDSAAVTALAATSLRYFNVVGSGYPDVWDVSPYNLFPAVMRALVAGRRPWVTGTDYPTPDGSCVRDYVHVADIALAHVAAAAALEEGRPLERAYNLGSGAGLSVLEIMDAFRRITGIDFAPELRERRPGDPARIVASGRRAARDLDWAMRHSVDDMVASAWASWPKDAAQPA